MCSPLLVVDATLDKSKFKPSHYFRSHRKKKQSAEEYTAQWDKNKQTAYIMWNFTLCRGNKKLMVGSILACEQALMGALLPPGAPGELSQRLGWYSNGWDPRECRPRYGLIENQRRTYYELLWIWLLSLLVEKDTRIKQIPSSLGQ